MEEFCRLAALNKSFYRLANTDFRSLCYKNLVYRLSGETWAEAFSFTNYRTIDNNIETFNAIDFTKQSICCSYTGTMALILEYKQILITNVDFRKKVFELHLINKSTQLLVDMETSYVVYDLRMKKIIKVYSALSEERYDFYTLYYSDGTLVDLYNQKEYKVKAAKSNYLSIINVDVHGYRKYVVYQNCQNELILIHVSTGRQDVILRFTYPDFLIIRILGSINQVMYLGMSARIYDIKTGTCVLQLDHSGVVYNEYKTKGIDGIHFYKDGKFIGYNKKTNNWEEMGRRPYQINFSMWFFHRDVLPLATIDCVEENSVVTLRHFDWSSGHLTSKNFQPINDNVMGFDYLILSNLKTTESQVTEESINDARRQFDNIIQNLSTNYLLVSALQI